jgi:hypothetical protein
MHNAVVFLWFVALLCAGQAYAQFQVHVYTFSDDTCQIPLTTVFPRQPEQLYLSPSVRDGSDYRCATGGEPCCLASQNALYGPIALGFSFGKNQISTPTNCTGKGMFTVHDIERTVEGSCTAGQGLIRYYMDRAAASCWPRPSRDYSDNLTNTVYTVVVPSFCPKPSLCTTCTETSYAGFLRPIYYYDTSPFPSSNGFCSKLDFSAYKYCSDRVLYRYYLGDCEKGSSRAVEMSALSCYTSCSTCITKIGGKWLSKVSSNPGALGMCSEALNSSYPYYFNSVSGCSSAANDIVSASSAVIITFPFFQFLAAAFLFFVQHGV